MPNWNQILDEIRTTGSTHDVIRRRFLQDLHKKTGRNIILYYSGWLQNKTFQASMLMIQTKMDL